MSPIKGTVIPYNVIADRIYYTVEFQEGAFDQFIEEQREYGRDVCYADDHMLEASQVIAREANMTLSLSSDSSGFHFEVVLPEDMEKWTTAQRDAYCAFEQGLLNQVSGGVEIYDYVEQNEEDEKPHVIVTRAGLRELSRVPLPAYTGATAGFRLVDGPQVLVSLQENKDGKYVEFSYKPSPKPEETAVDEDLSEGTEEGDADPEPGRAIDELLEESMARARSLKPRGSTLRLV